MKHSTLVVSVLVAAAAAACGSSGARPAISETEAQAPEAPELQAFADRFDPETIIGPPRLVDCTLSGGASATCVAITVAANPETFDMGPWCPTNVSAGAEAGGIWLEGGRVYDVDGSFIENLATFYDDPSWQMYDAETGDVNVTDTLEACEAAARPDVDPRYQNHCVECLASYIRAGLTNTYVIPLEPVAAARAEPRVGHGGVGVAYRGVRLDGPAPVDAILGAHTLAPFDDCGGHINPAVGYHVHAATDCLERDAAEPGHGAEIGVALDGHPLYARLDASGAVPADLDGCGGHTTADEGYHYHVGAAGSNAILRCHTGQTGCVLSDPDAPCDATAVRGPPGGGPPGGGPPGGGPPGGGPPGGPRPERGRPGASPEGAH